MVNRDILGFFVVFLVLQSAHVIIAFRFGFHQNHGILRRQPPVEVYRLQRSTTTSQLHSQIIARESDRLLLPWSIVEVTGPDSLKFLQGLSTGDFRQAVTPFSQDASQIEQKIPVSFVTDIVNNKGKLVAHLVAIICGADNVQLLIEDSAASTVMSYLQDFIFPIDKVQIKLSPKASTSVFAIFNQDCYELINQEGIENWTHIAVNVFSSSKTAHNELSIDANSIEGLLQHSSVAIHTKKEQGSNAAVDDRSTHNVQHLIYELLRLYVGRPGFSTEIIDMHSSDAIGVLPRKTLKKTTFNPSFSSFELGTAESSIALQKGCYTGQEIISKALKSLTATFETNANCTDEVSKNDVYRAYRYVKGSAWRQCLVPLTTITSISSRLQEKNVSSLEAYVPLLSPGTLVSVLSPATSDERKAAETEVSTTVSTNLEDIGIVTSCAAYILNNLLIEKFGIKSLVPIPTSSATSKVDLKLLKNHIVQLLESYQGDFQNSDSNNEVNRIIAMLVSPDSIVLDNIIQRILVMLRVKVLPQPSVDIKKSEKFIVQDKDSGESFELQFQKPLSDVYRPLLYPDYSFQRLLSSLKEKEPKADPTSPSSVAGPKESIPSLSNTSLKTSISSNKEEEAARIAAKLAKRQDEINALLAARKQQKQQ